MYVKHHNEISYLHCFNLFAVLHSAKTLLFDLHKWQIIVLLNNVALFAVHDDIFFISRIKTVFLQKWKVESNNKDIKYFVQIICYCTSKPGGC